MRGSRLRGNDGGVLLVFGHFCHLSHLCRARSFRSDQEWGPPYLGPIWPDLPLAAGTGAIPGVERSSGVRRSGKLLIRFRLVPFRSIPIPRTLILTFSQRANGPTVVRRSGETFNIGLISAQSLSFLS